MRRYRSAGKRAGTYGAKWLAEHAAGGAVLCRWNQLGSESGRMSIASPNVQQLPRVAEYRKGIVAPPGMLLVKADYSQIELRLAAKIANDTAMKAAYEAGRDSHSLTAARVLGKPVGEVVKADRQLAKAVNFGLHYGMGHESLRGYALANYGVPLTEAQARSYREAFFKAYPALRRWHDRTRSHLRKLFHVDPTATLDVRTVGGRRRTLPVAAGADGNKYPNLSEALNMPVQGTGADGLKAAVALLWERRAEVPGAVPLQFVHDEVVLAAPAERAAAAAAWLVRCMTDGMAPFADPVPVEVEVTAGRTWAGD